jgi:ribose transport system substrate-binding protein
MKGKLITAALTAGGLLLAGCSLGDTPSGGTGGATTSSAGAGAAAAPGHSVIDRQITGTTGPNGEKPTPVSQLTLTDQDIASLQGGHYSAAELWHTSSAFVNAVQSGASAEFQRVGVKVVATASANMDAGAQANQVQTTLAKKPNVILSLPVDPVSAAQAFQPAVAAGTKLVFLSNVPKGFTYGQQYTAIVTDDLYQMGKQAAEALGEALGGKGNIGVIFYNAQYYVTNQRDAAFLTILRKGFPGIKVVAQQGFSDPSTTQQVASAMLTQHPNLDGIYVSYAQPAAEGVLSALRTVANTHTKVVTLDIDNPIMIDMATTGSTVGVVADRAWELGKGMADAALYALLGKKAPAFAVAGALTITKDSIAQGYQDSLHQPVPPDVAKVLK